MWCGWRSWVCGHGKAVNSFRGGRRTVQYKELCEQIYRTWRNDPGQFADFDSDFNVFSLPEPYFPLSTGKSPLVVLNNNPGGVLPFQRHSSVVNEFDDSMTYADVAWKLMGKYKGPPQIISAAAQARNSKILNIARALGHDCVENVEMFFLHSSSFDKTAFMRNYAKHTDVVAYHDALRVYLADRSVVIIAAVASRSSLSIESITGSPWLRLQTSVAGMELGQATLEPTSIKDGKVTSAVIRSGGKTLVCMMGSNNIPKEALGALGG